MTALLVFLVVMNDVPATILSGSRDAGEGDVAAVVAFGLAGGGRDIVQRRRVWWREGGPHGSATK